MAKFLTYHPFQKSIVFLLLFGLVWTTTISIGILIFDSDIELTELYGGQVNQSEEEETKKEKKDKLNNKSFQSRINSLNRFIKIMKSDGLVSQHHPELSTPPPEDILFS